MALKTQDSCENDFERVIIYAKKNILSSDQKGFSVRYLANRIHFYCRPSSEVSGKRAATKLTIQNKCRYSTTYNKIINAQ